MRVFFEIYLKLWDLNLLICSLSFQGLKRYRNPHHSCFLGTRGSKTKGHLSDSLLSHFLFCSRIHVYLFLYFSLLLLRTVAPRPPSSLFGWIGLCFHSGVNLSSPLWKSSYLFFHLQIWSFIRNLFLPYCYFKAASKTSLPGRF